MTKYEQLQEHLKDNQSTWLVTGAAGFIGSNILEELLSLNQKVIGIDNFSTGFKENLEDVKSEVLREQWKNFHFIEDDICNLKSTKNFFKDADFILHQAAFGSVPRSIKDPISSTISNVNGFLNILNLSKDNNTPLTYASSSSVYGDNPDLPKIENKIGNPLSTYALTKLINELYSKVFSLNYDHSTIGLRYFNVFGKRQNPNGEYAAVIPKWISAMISNEEIIINGDGTTSRDFCFVENAVQINLLSALSNNKAKNNIYNVACGDSTSLNDLFFYIKGILKLHGIDYSLEPVYQDFRQGDVKHSLANISKSRSMLNYEPQYSIEDGLSKTIASYLNN